MGLFSGGVVVIHDKLRLASLDVGLQRAGDSDGWAVQLEWLGGFA